MNPEATKHFEFTAGAGSFFVMWLVGTLLSMIPFVGFAFAFNYQNGWLAKNIKIDGRGLAYKAGFGESWVLLFVGILLTIITVGVYTFWFVPKVYRYVFSHMSYSDEVPAAPAPAPAAAPASETTPPASPTPPAAPLVQ